MSNSRILKEVFETAEGLNKAGVISKLTMHEYDQLCLAPVHELSSSQIKTLREKSHLSQAMFAALLNISSSTVQKWEIGQKKPCGSALKLLNLIEKKGINSLI